MRKTSYYFATVAASVVIALAFAITQTLMVFSSRSVTTHVSSATGSYDQILNLDMDENQKSWDNKMTTLERNLQEMKSLVDALKANMDASVSTTSDQHGLISQASTKVAMAPSPFQMPIKGDKFEIFQPLFHMEESKKNPTLFATPQAFLITFEERISWVNTMTSNEGKSQLDVHDVKDHAALMYLEMIKSFVSGFAFHKAELSVKPKLGNKILTTAQFDAKKRAIGNDWTYAGDTMTGWKRIDNVYNLLKDVIENNIKGDYIETGVWRGGSSIFAKAALSVLEPGSSRVSYVCDSFQGLPPGDKQLDKRDKNWDNTPYLEVSSDTVANNFIKYGLLDSNVVFAKGFFNETMPHLSKHIQTLSIMRLDVSLISCTSFLFQYIVQFTYSF